MRRAVLIPIISLWSALASGCGGHGPTAPSEGTVVQIVLEGEGTIDVGSRTRLVAGAVYSDGTKREVTQEAAWSSENPEIAQVEPTGWVIGLKVGRVKISASFGGQTASGTLAVLGAQTHGSITLLQLECLGSCENITQGKGDFSYIVDFFSSAGGHKTLAGTAGFPSPGAVIRLGTGESYSLGDSADFTVRDQEDQGISLYFAATEWDKTILGADTPDPDMNRREAEAQYQYRGAAKWIPEGPNTITLGSGSCRIRLRYVINMLPN